MRPNIKEFILTPFSYWLGMLYYKFQNWDKADAWLSYAMEMHPNHAETLFRRGFIRFKRKEWFEAFPYIQKALVLKPSREEWLKSLDVVEQRIDAEIPKSFLTEEELQKLIEAAPKSPFLHSQLARHFQIHHKWWLQIEALRTAVKLDESNAGYHCRLAEALGKMKRYSEAAAEYERATALSDRNPLWFYKAGYSLTRIPDGGIDERAKAQVFYDTAVAHPRNIKHRHLGIGAFHQKFGRWNLAAEAFEKQLTTLDSSHSGSSLFQLGFCHDRMYRWERAEQCYLKAIAKRDCMPEWRYRLGFVHERQEKFLESAEAYLAAVESAGKAPSSWYYRLGYVLAKVGKHEDGGKYFEKSCIVGDDDLGPNMNWLEELEIPSNDFARRLEFARDQLVEELSRDATSAGSWNRLGSCYELAGRWEEAVEAYQQSVLRTGKHHPQRFQRLGHCLMMLGRYEEATDAFVGIRPIQRPHGLNKSLFQGDPAFRNVAVYNEYYETLPIQPKTVLYESFHGKVVSCNPYALFLHLLKDPARADWIHVWSVNDFSCVPERFKKLRNVIFIIRGTDGYMRYLASAGLLINNVTFHTYFIRRKEQIYLNTWHGTPWKTLGKHVLGETLGYGNMSRNFLQATHLLSPNRHTSDALIHSYDIDGLEHGALLELGYPRIDLTLNASEETKEGLKKRLGIDGSKKVVLYAPTWRGTHAAPAKEEEEVDEEIGRLMEADCHLLFRGHTLSGRQERECCVPEDVATNELLAVVDILITDYSSICFDFLATGRPILFYLKDLERYTAERGLYFGTDRLPGPVSEKLDSLVADLRNCMDGVRHPAYETAKAEFCPHEDGNACQRTIKALYTPSGKSLTDLRSSILMFGGKLIPNGITSSLINLLEAVDHTKYRVTLQMEPSWLGGESEDQRRFDRIAAVAQVLPRAGRINLSHEEKWIQNEFRDSGALPDSPEIREIYERSFAREYRRLVGESRFDAVIEFEGYNVFWASVLGCAPPDLVKNKTIYQHNDLMGECKVRFPYLRQIFDLYRYFDRVISVSRMTMELNLHSLAAPFDIDESKFGYVENVLNPNDIVSRAAAGIDAGEDTELFGGDGPVFVTVGRLSIEKDHRKLIRAFGKVTRRRSSARLLIIGDGPLRANLERLVKRLKLDDAVRLLGFRENPFPYLLKSDCFVLSSNHEGQPMVLLEAIILNRPIIATDIAGSRGVIEGRSGHLVENSVAGLAGGMRDFIDGKVSAREVDMDRYRIDALEAFYEKACALPESVDVEEAGAYRQSV